jgi:glucose/arabinose dehydrogenase
MNRQGRRAARLAHAPAHTSRPPILTGGARRKRLSAFALAAARPRACSAARASAATLPAGFAEAQIAVGLNSPTAMAFAPDGRVFVCLQGGQLRVVKNGALLPTPFLAVTVSSVGERGLLGVAFDPDFASNRFVYVYYTATTPTIHNRVSRFTASAANPDVAEAGSEVILLDLENLGATNHNGGAMHFGADGKLYIAVGDNAASGNAQVYTNKLGKVLRINPDPANLIPSDNPFLSRTSGTNQSIWALGLRNPYTFAVQPGTGRIFINDVGELTWEEINNGAAGVNYGWPACEGNCPVPSPTPAIRPPDTFTNPVLQYPHSGAQPAGCAVTGGTFYNPQIAQFPPTYLGKYFFADFCTGFIRYIDPDSPSPSQPFATGLASPVDLQVSADGSLWYLERGNTGRLVRIRHTAGSQPPSITEHPQSQTVAAGASVTFTVSAEGSGTLLYQWQRNGVDIAGATSQSYTINSAAAADNGAQFRAVVTNPFGGAASNAATLTVTTNAPPSAQIDSPPAGTTYAAGDTVNFSGSATDAQDGTLPASAFTWRVDFHHDDHTHPFVAPFSNATSGSFNIPTTGETSANVFYRIHLSVTDSAGASHQVSRDVTPRTSTITLRTNPAGLQLTLDGQPRADGYSELNVVNIQRTLGAPSQTVGGITYNFVSWSDGGAATHNINVPAANTTYTANFTRQTEAGEIVVSEFRADGPAGSTDEFVELYNRTDRDITVASADGSAGWAIVAGSSVLASYHVIPAGTVIPARSRYLVAGAQYSLANYGGANAAAPDATSASDLAPSGTAFRGLGLFRSSDPSGFTSENRLDSVGCAADPHPLLVEAAGVGPCQRVGTAAQPATDYSLVRRLTSAGPQDANDNAADFQLVAVQTPLVSAASGTTLAAVLGAPGPENAAAPAQRNQTIKAALVDPCAGPDAAPNQERDSSFSDPANNQTHGTLAVRRRFTNNTGADVVRLRFRIIDVTTAPAPPCTGACDGVDDTADLRALDSPTRPSFDVTGFGCAGTRAVVIDGLTLESPPAQAEGGGHNSSLAVGTITPQKPLPPGASVNVEFLLGVERPGLHRFLINVEALPVAADAMAAPARSKAGGTSKGRDK